MLFKNNKVILAPMAGITDKVFRSICKKQGADIVLSEMVSAEGLLYGASATFELLRFEESERPIGIQLFGADPQHLAEAARIVQEKVQPDFIDLNAGCPVSKVVKRNGGSALMRDPELFGRIVTSMVKALSIPLTVKIRSGWQKYDWTDLEFAAISQDCGASAITIHPRSQTMGFSGHSFWERITEVKKRVSIPVIGNGDIRNAQDALEMLHQTGCDSVMIGRATYGNPWVFSNVKAALQGKPQVLVTPEMKINMALKHLSLFRKQFSEIRTYKEMKKHLAWYIKGISDASHLRDRIFRADSSEEMKGLLEEVRGILGQVVI